MLTVTSSVQAQPWVTKLTTQLWMSQTVCVIAETQKKYIKRKIERVREREKDGGREGERWRWWRGVSCDTLEVTLRCVHSTQWCPEGKIRDTYSCRSYFIPAACLYVHCQPRLDVSELSEDFIGQKWEIFLCLQNHQKVQYAMKLETAFVLFWPDYYNLTNVAPC